MHAWICTKWTPTQKISQTRSPGPSQAVQDIADSRIQGHVILIGFHILADCNRTLSNAPARCLDATRVCWSLTVMIDSTVCWSKSVMQCWELLKPVSSRMLTDVSDTVARHPFWITQVWPFDHYISVSGSVLNYIDVVRSDLTMHAAGTSARMKKELYSPEFLILSQDKKAAVRTTRVGVL